MSFQQIVARKQHAPFGSYIVFFLMAIVMGLLTQGFFLYINQALRLNKQLDFFSMQVV